MRAFPLFLLLLSLLAACKKKPEQTKPIFGPIVEAVYASGKVKARDQIQVFPQVSGKISRVLVNPGDAVALNQILVEIENKQSLLNQENARLSFEYVKENAAKQSDRMQELELGLKLAREKLALDSALFQKQKVLMEQNIGTRLEYDQRKLAFENSRTAVSTAQKRLGQLRTQLQNDMNRAQVGLQQASLATADFVVKAPFHAKVFDVLRKEGELVNPQIPIAVIGQPDSFYLELQVNENDITKISVGQEIALTIEAFPEKVFSATVARIVPIMNERSRNFRVDARFAQMPAGLYPNLNVEANIVISQKENTLVIPRRFLSEDDHVWISETEKKKVKTGIRDYQKVEILEGIDSTTTVYMPPK